MSLKISKNVKHKFVSSFTCAGVLSEAGCHSKLIEGPVSVVKIASSSFY